MLDNNDDIHFTVTDLKQFFYCERIVYYHTCLPDIRPVTFKMKAGIRRHEDEHKRSIRRTMRLLDIETARRIFDVPVKSCQIGLSGQVDELLVFEDKIVPIDYKLAKRAGIHYKVQLAAYAMMIEETYESSVKEGILYLIQNRQTVEVKITRALREKVIWAVEQMWYIANSEAMPKPTERREQCSDCEFRRFCNDI